MVLHAGAEVVLCAGLVFTVSCEPYLLDEYGHPADAPVLLQADYLHGQQQHAEHEVRTKTPCDMCCLQLVQKQSAAVL